MEKTKTTSIRIDTVSYEKLLMLTLEAYKTNSISRNSISAFIRWQVNYIYDKRQVIKNKQ